MNAKVREFGVALCVSLLAIITLLLPVRETNAQSASNPPSQNQGKEEKVSDTSRTIDVEGVGSVEVFESVNTPDRYYIAPVFDFVLIEPSVIAKFSDTDEAIKMKVKMVPPDVRKEVAESLTSLMGRRILVQNVGNLRLYAVFIDVDSQTTKNNFEVKEFRIENPVSTQGLDVSLDVKKEKGKDLAAAINRGEITFRLSYAYNSINLDSRREELRVRTVLDSSSYRRLEQQGQELMTADQMAEAAANMKRDITSVVYLGLGKIDSESLPIDKLITLFDIGETWKMDDDRLKEMEEEFIKRFDLKVNPADFQPFRVQKKVVETILPDKNPALFIITIS